MSSTADIAVKVLAALAAGPKTVLDLKAVVGCRSTTSVERAVARLLNMKHIAFQGFTDNGARGPKPAVYKLAGPFAPLHREQS